MREARFSSDCNINANDFRPPDIRYGLGITTRGNHPSTKRVFSYPLLRPETSQKLDECTGIPELTTSESTIKQDTTRRARSMDELTRWPDLHSPVPSCVGTRELVPQLISEQGVTLPPLPFAKSQEFASQLDNERSRNERELKRRCLGPATGQDLAVDSQARETRDLKIDGTQDEHGKLQNSLNLDQIDDLIRREQDVNDSIQTWKASIRPPTDSSTTRDFRMPGSEPPENNHDLEFFMYGRGRTLQRIAHTHYSLRTRPARRAGSASSARSMIDERLEWAHQDRVRSASRDRSAPPSPFHEHSPFYAEFGRYTYNRSPSNDNEPRDITPIDPSHGAGIQRYTCRRMNPFTRRLCNTVFHLPQDWTKHEDTIHCNRMRRFVCPNCHEKQSFSRIEGLTRHMRVMHTEDTHHWSCAALANLEDAICRVALGFTVCAYCGMELPDSLSDEELFEHLSDTHHFGKCDTTTKFFRPDHFLKHLQESHGASRSGEWINILCNRCFGNDQMVRGARDAGACASHTSLTPKLSTASPEESLFQKPNISRIEYQGPDQTTYVCECCPVSPKTFASEQDLRYVINCSLQKKLSN